ncbi:MAG: hypothetical protein IE887_00755 [Campylobacterales bacterium]|nr:hypothetical protein [Campylobacterales bacterium]
MERHTTAEHLFKTTNLEEHVIKTSNFQLCSIKLPKRNCSDQVFHVYIEGDGIVYKTRYLISEDPTPIDPLGLKLMLSDPSDCKAYIARPCQYIDSKM